MSYYPEPEYQHGMLVFIENATIMVITIILAFLADYIVKKIIISSIAQLAKHSKNEWDDVFVNGKCLTGWPTWLRHYRILRITSIYLKQMD